MNKLIAAMALTGAAVLALPALAGDTHDGFTCDNVCPLAQQANTRRAAGTEAVAASTVVRNDVADQVARNLDRI